MSRILSNQQGVQASAAVIGSLTGGITQLIGINTARSDVHKGSADGIARLNAHSLNRIARQTMELPCATIENLRAFMKNAAQTTVSLDHARSVSISELQAGGAC